LLLSVLVHAPCPRVFLSPAQTRRVGTARKSAPLPTQRLNGGA
jgi:hypothetical protein